MRMLSPALTAILILACLAAQADTLPSAPTPTALSPIAPDRPGFTNGSDTLAPGHIQVELGAASTTAPASSRGATTFDYPEPLVRVGCSPTVELRIGLPDYQSVRHGGHGFSDGSLGAKIKVYQSKDGNTKAALTPAITVPTGGDFSSGHIDPLLTLGAQTASGARWSISANVALSDASNGNSRTFAAAPSAAVAYQMTPLVSAYGELYDSLPARGGSSPLTDGGFTFLLNPNLQLDVEAGAGLGGNAPVRFAGAGIAVRY